MYLHLTQTITWSLSFYSCSIYERWVYSIDEAARFTDDCISQTCQLRWESHLSSLAHILSALPYLGLTAAEGNNVCQESVKLYPKPTLLFKSTSQVPTSLCIAKLTVSNTNKPANSITTRRLWNSPQKETFWIDSLTTLHRTLHHKKQPLFISFSVLTGELAAELVSKTPWSEARDVWLKLGLLSVCHPDLTRGELFVPCFLSLFPSVCAPTPQWLGMSPAM